MEVVDGRLTVPKFEVIRVLGPIEVVGPEGVVEVGGRRMRALLAALVIAVDHAVPAEHLAWVVWGDDPPVSAAGTLQGCISRLRSILGEDALEYAGHAYRLRADPGQIDAVEFERLAREADDARSDPATCRRLCGEALGLWRGVPFADLADEDPFRLEALRLDEIRVATMEQSLAADLALGHHGAVVGALESLVQDHPYRERLWALLVEALAREGRRVEALRAADRLRHLLAEAGLEPTCEFEALEREVLGVGTR